MIYNITCLGKVFFHFELDIALIKINKTMYAIVL